MSLPLESIKVLDLSRLLPGPYCSWLLADMGAEIIRVEQPKEVAKQDAVFSRKKIDRKKREEIRAYDFLSRNKRSLLINLKEERAREIIYKLAQKSDVFLEDYRPGVMKQIALDYASIKKINPQIIYCSISLCGQDGPYRDLPGHDPIALSLAGVLSQLGQDGETPTLPGPPIGDIVAGLHAAVGILVSLNAREKEGHGQHVDISMVDCARGLLSMTYQRYFRDGFILKRGWKSPHIGIWETKDKKHICRTDMEPRYWANFCKAIGREDFIPYQHDLDRRETMIQTIREIFLTKGRDEWFEILRQAGSQAAPVYEIDEALLDPQALHRQMVVEIDHPNLGKVKQLDTPIKLSETPVSTRHMTPLPGENTEEILKQLGYTREQIETLTEQGVVQLSMG